MATRAPVLLLTGLCTCAFGAQPARLAAGRAQVEFSPESAELCLLREGERLLCFARDAFQLGVVAALDERMSYDPYWLEEGNDLLPSSAPSDLRWLTPSRTSLMEIGESRLALLLEYEEGLRAHLEVGAAAPGRFAARLVPEGSGPAIAWLRLRPRMAALDAPEAFYGLGEWPDDVNHRGRARPMQMELAATESSNNENHVPVPLLISSRGHGIFVASRRVGLFDVGKKAPDHIEITYGTAEESERGLDFHLFVAPHPLDVLKLYYDTTSYPLLPAPWALGPWIWRDENRDQAEVLADIATLRALDLPTSAIWIDRPYASAVGAFDFDRARFPDPAGMVRAAHQAGLRVALWQAPYIAKEAGPLLAQARQAGFFPKKSGILLNKWGEPIDLTNPAAHAFWQDLIGRYARLGVEGYKLDYGEDVVPGLGGVRNVWRFSDGSDERTMHHDYTLLYHRVYAETLPKAAPEGGGAFLLCRAGRWGDQRHVSVVWPGDMDATFTRHGEPFVPRGGTREVIGVGGLPATIVQALSLSASGFPFFGADTGGYRHSPPDKELYIRWFQQTALSAVMQVGDSSSQPPWEFTAENGRDTETLDLYRQYARLHIRLFPYAWTLALRMLTDGRPLLRALGLAHPELGVHPSDTYLFGEDLLVAPVTVRGARSRRVHFPPGAWIDYFDGTLHDGGAGGAIAEVDAPLHKLPLFLRAGAIVPLLGPTIDTLAPATLPGIESYADRPGVLHARIFPSANGGRLVLFDGTEIEHADSGRRLVTRGGRTFRAGVVLEVLRARDPASVLAGGAALPRLSAAPALEAVERGYLFDEAGPGTLWIRLPPGDHEVEVR